MNLPDTLTLAIGAFLLVYVACCCRYTVPRDEQTSVHPSAKRAWTRHTEGRQPMSEQPKRIQLRRAKGWRKPQGAVVVARPSKWGNPFRAKRKGGFQWVEDERGRSWGSVVCSTDREGTRLRMVRESVELFRLHIGPMGNYEYDASRLAELSELRGLDLACWCPLDQPCHADVLLELANS